ncbi:VWA domain-containing protein [Vibrio sp. B1Z05]|uniref:vWA domain-containing protein n=1 Tax=Vibrio sp. B1Z05 TaxID=2654980 RepID=UPI00128E754F|nr:VWA domain-containing protein [Vibrio sp. B1Z05]MPW35853.1 VWA domain-containing protein [Vibrio sp. B1Z05]
MFDFALVEQLFWQQILTQFHFIRPLWLLALLPLCTVIYWRWKLDTQRQGQAVLPKHLIQALSVGQQGWRKQLPLKFLSVVMSLAIVLCAGPTWQRAPSPFGEDKASLLIALDNSASMQNEDLAPTRLTRAKQKIHDLLELRDGGQTGLVVFAGTSHLAMPLTKDRQVFAPFLAAIDPDIMPVKGKRADSIIEQIDSQLSEKMPASVLLISDGVTPDSLVRLAEYFTQSPHQLLILATGNPKLKSNNPMDLSSLQRLAGQSGASLEVVSIDNTDVLALERKIQRHMQLNNESAMPWQDMGYYLLFPIALLLLLWFRKGWLVQWVVIGCVLAPCYSASVIAAPVYSVSAHQAESGSAFEEVTTLDKVSSAWTNLWLTTDQQGQWHFNRQRYLQAATHFQDPMRKGIAYYYAAEYSLAHSAFLNADSANGAFYAGIALARQREYLKARDLFAYLLSEKRWPLTPELRSQIEHNLMVMQGIVDEVNRLSASQAGTTDGAEDSIELGDNPQTGDGAEDTAVAEMMLKESLNANEILGSEELADKWLRRVESDPKLFLRAKFQIQRSTQQAQERSDAQ